MKLKLLLLTLLVSSVLPAAARADVVLYRIPGSNLMVVLQGTTTVNPGSTISYRHPKFGRIVFGYHDIIFHKAPTTTEIFRKRMNLAGTRRDTDEVMEIARWALRHGLLPQFYEAVEKTLEIDPQHEDAQRVMQLKQEIDIPLRSNPAEEASLRAMVGKRGMRIQLSPHFMMLHDTAEPTASDRKMSRAEERLMLLEQVYESFLMKFYANGVALNVPKERLKVVLFKEHQDYLLFVQKLDPELTSAAGFWDSRTNVAVFYDQGSSDTFEALQQLSAELQNIKESSKRNVTAGTKDIVRLADTISMLVEIERENLDIEVVSHEATHQMAGNTGLLPRHVQIPSWVHEGLATYFETPSDASWSGFGAVNSQRLDWYRQLEADVEHSNIDFIAQDQIFTYAATLGAELHGYGQAWALTHFLVERHFDKYMNYCRRLGEMPPDLTLSPEVLKSIFDESFGEDRLGLDAEWREYMRGLRTNIDEIIDQVAR